MKDEIHTLNLFQYLESIFLLLAGGYLVYLRLTGALKFYIRPDYFLFTFIMGLILTGAGILNIYLLSLTPKPKRYVWSVRFGDAVKLGIITLVLCAGVFIPKQSLSSQTALRRGASTSLLTGAQAGLKRDLTSLTVSPLSGKSISNNYSIADWMGVFQIDPEPNDYTGKQVHVIGFVQPQPDGTFMVSRFVISCCIADAQPIGIYVDRNLNDLKANEWIDVKGTFEVKTIKGTRQAIIKPDTVEKVSAPSDPYLY